MLKVAIALSVLALCCFASPVVAQGPIFIGPQPRSVREHKVKLLPVGEPAPNWELRDQEGKVHSLGEYRGKVVVMDFWATWCGPCAEVMPRMQKLHEKFADKGVVVLGVNSWEENDPIALMQKKRFSYRLLLKGENLAEAYKVTMLPVVYIIGDDGTIIYCHGGVDDKNLTSLIQKYIEGRRIT
jgi:peroxiredoxin